MMELRASHEGFSDVHIVAETEDHIIVYDNSKDNDFNWGTVAVRHNKSQRTMMYYLFRGDQVPYKYKEQMDAIEERFNKEKTK